MNNVILMGRLARDPDVRYTQGAESFAVARYTLAVNRRKKAESGEQEADFISCIAFRKGAEFAEKYLKKGTMITIRGHIQTGSYTNKDGVKIYTTDVVVDEQEFAGSKSDNSGAAAPAGNQAAAPKNQAAPATATPPVGDGFEDLMDTSGFELDDDEGLPFN